MMFICRYVTDSGPGWGLVEDGHVYLLEGTPFGDAAHTPARRPTLERGPVVGAVEEVTLLPPVTPGKIIAVGRNYAAHARELGNTVPDEPLLFFKPPSSVTAAESAIELLPDSGRVDIEGELAVVMGRRGRFIPPEEALGYVLGYTSANDMSDRDWQRSEQQWLRAKGQDTFCPLGPWLATGLEPSALVVESRVNGERVQHASTGDMVFSVPHLIATISRFMTLEPGDVILTGTPEGVTQIQSGDIVEVEIDGIGVLRNPVTIIPG